MESFRHRIRKIYTVKFETVDFTNTPDDKIRLDTKIDYNLSESHFIDVVGHFVFYIDGSKKTVTAISVGTKFDILPEDLNNLRQEDGTINLNKETAIYLAGLMVGAARGILAIRTENTIFSKFILPPINVSGMLPKYVKIIPI